MERPNTPPSRTIPPVRPARPCDNAGTNERFLRTMLALIMENAESRTNAGSFGEVIVKFKWQAGRITDARFYPESTFKPEE